MATKQNGITRADAIAYAIKACEGNSEVVDVLTKMHAQLTKPRAKAVSKARKVNEDLAAKVRDAISANGDGMSTKDIVALGLPEVTTTQKAAAVARVAVELGYLTKNVNGKAITYALAQATRPEHDAKRLISLCPISLYTIILCTNQILDPIQELPKANFSRRPKELAKANFQIIPIQESN